MDSNSDKLTNKENMSGEPSLASIESGFVSLTGSKAKETVNGGNDLEIEKNKDAKILVENGGNDIKNDKKEKTNKLQFILWLFNCFASIIKICFTSILRGIMNFISCLCNCFASINKDCLTSFLSGLVAFLVTTVVILFVFLIFGGFWVVFNNIVNDPFFGEYWFIPATLLIIALLCIICLLLWHLYDAITSCPLDSETKELINIIFNILFSFLFLMFFIITFVLIMVIFYLIFEYIIYADLSKNRVFTNRFISAILALLGFFGSLALYFSGLFALLINCHE